MGSGIPPWGGEIRRGSQLRGVCWGGEEVREWHAGEDADVGRAYIPHRVSLTHTLDQGEAKAESPSHPNQSPCLSPIRMPQLRANTEATRR